MPQVKAQARHFTPDINVTFHLAKDDTVINLKRCNGNEYLSRLTIKLRKHSITITSNLLLLLICVMHTLIIRFHYIEGEIVFCIWLLCNILHYNYSEERN